MAWRLARSLSTLRDQVNALSPNRSKISDGTIGDAAHASRSSDHNPWVMDGKTPIVTGMDITNDPGHGVVSRTVAEALRQSRDLRIKYVISDGEIFSGEGEGKPPWVWRKYTGKNAHTHHFHISVQETKSLYDGVAGWELPGFTVAPSKAAKPLAREKNPVLVKGNKGADVERLQKLLNDWGASPALRLDADFWEKTEKAVKTFQRKNGLEPDGRVGVYTWGKLLAEQLKAAA